MENNKTTQQLFNDLTERLIIPLDKPNEIVCPTCKGLKFIYKQKNKEEGIIENCTDCHNGKLYVCKHCGKANKTDYCDCKEAQRERDNKFNEKEYKKELELFKQAKKIKFKDYDGYFILKNDELVRCKDSIEDLIYDQIKYEKLTNEELPKYLWATKPTPVFDLNIYDIIYNECEDGYEDMYNCLDTDDEDLEKAQEYLDKWYKKQGDGINIYNEDYTIAILLDDLIKEIRDDIEKE